MMNGLAFIELKKLTKCIYAYLMGLTLIRCQIGLELNKELPSEMSKKCLLIRLLLFSSYF